MNALTSVTNFLQEVTPFLNVESTLPQKKWGAAHRSAAIEPF
jgi:hypothetical protein